MPDALVTSTNCAAGTVTSGLGGVAAGTTLLSTNLGFSCGRWFRPYTTPPATASASTAHSERRKARPMRRSSASTSSSPSVSRFGGRRSFIRGSFTEIELWLQDRHDIAEVGALALQFIDDHRLGGAIGRRVARAVQGHGRVAGVVVGLVAGVKRALFGSALLVAELRIDE